MCRGSVVHVVVVVVVVRSSILDSSKHAVTVLLSSTCTPSTSCYISRWWQVYFWYRSLKTFLVHFVHPFTHIQPQKFPLATTTSAGYFRSGFKPIDRTDPIHVIISSAAPRNLMPPTGRHINGLARLHYHDNGFDVGLLTSLHS
jgi:hypothetical protein